MSYQHPENDVEVFRWMVHLWLDGRHIDTQYFSKRPTLQQLEDYGNIISYEPTRTQYLAALRSLGKFKLPSDRLFIMPFKHTGEAPSNASLHYLTVERDLCRVKYTPAFGRFPQEPWRPIVPRNAT